MITPGPDLSKRADPGPNPLADDICGTPYMHTETKGSWFLAAWLGCDRWRQECCAPGYISYAQWVSADSRYGSASDFRVTACPSGFGTGMLAATDMPSGVKGVCCPPNFSPLPSFDGDWSDWGALCTRAMTGNEAIQSSTYPLVLPNPSVQAVQSFGTAPKRFQNRFQAVGYFLDPAATAGTFSATASSSTTGASAGSGGAAVCTGTAAAARDSAAVVGNGNTGVPAGAVAGVAVGSVFAGVALGALGVWLVFRRRGKEPYRQPPWTGSELESKTTASAQVQSPITPTPARVEMAVPGTELEDTSRPGPVQVR